MANDIAVPSPPLVPATCRSSVQKVTVAQRCNRRAPMTGTHIAFPACPLVFSRLRAARALPNDDDFSKIVGALGPTANPWQRRTSLGVIHRPSVYVGAE